MRLLISAVALLLVALLIFAQGEQYCWTAHESCLAECCVRYGGDPGGPGGCSEGFRGNYATLCYAPCDDALNQCLQASEGGWEDEDYGYDYGEYGDSGSCCGGALILLSAGIACMMVAGIRGAEKCA